MDRLAQLATGAGPASRVEADDKEDDDVPDAAPVVIDEIGEVFSWRDFLSFVGEDQDQWTTVALILNACFWFTSTSLGALPLPGPGIVMSIAYVDPANFESDMIAGVLYGCRLLWVLVWATAAGYLIQTLAIRLALGGGQHLAQACRHEYPRNVRWALWFIAEVTVVASDIPEVIGSAIGLRLLFGIPTWVGIVVTAIDSVLFLALGAYGVRKLEALMGALVGAMSISWLIVLSRADFDAGEVVVGMLRPSIPDSNALYIAVSLLGAVVMPHNLFLHSGLVLSRKIPASEKAKNMAMRYNNLESALALSVTLFINLAVVVVSAATVASPLVSAEERAGIIEQPLSNGPKMLERVLGKSSDTLFAIALLASGQSSTITGTYAGEYVMLGFLDFHVPRLVTLAAGESGTEQLIVLCSVILSFQLPFALIPLVKFSGEESMLGAMAVSRRSRWALYALAALVVLANIYLMMWAIYGSGAVDASPGGVLLGILAGIFGVGYVGALWMLARKPVTQAYDERQSAYQELSAEALAEAGAAGGAGVVGGQEDGAERDGRNAHKGAGSVPGRGPGGYSGVSSSGGEDSGGEVGMVAHPGAGADGATAGRS